MHKFLIVFFIVCASWSTTLRGQKVAAAVDSTSIAIGSQLRYQIQVEADKGVLVVFPEGQTFTPLEMVESFKIDTTNLQAKRTFTKQYALTQFDSGSYMIPQQKVIIGDQTILTDSLRIEVRDILVDTTKQKLYDIKPLIAVEAPSKSWTRHLKWLLPLLILLGLVVYFVLKKNKIRWKAKKKLPAYDRALLALQQIDNDHLLENEAYKEYYSQLSQTARQYLDEEVYDHAMESTTEELIKTLETKSKSGKLNLDKSVINELKQVLQTADLAKFAKSKPDAGTARADRDMIENVIKKTKIAIPQPSEEELLKDAAYREELAAKKKKKQILTASILSLIALICFLVTFTAVNGLDNTIDLVMQNKMKKLSEGEWITSSYGSPPVTITTPKVLSRINEKIPEELAGQVSFTTFSYNKISDPFSIKVSTGIVQGKTEFDLEQVTEGNIKLVEQLGVRNMITKNEEFKTPGGAEGLKTFGTAEIPISTNSDEFVKGNYVALLFNEKDGLQQITLTWMEEDRYAKAMVDRIINSLELSTTEE